MTAGSEIRQAPTSTCSRRACVPSKKGCRMVRARRQHRHRRSIPLGRIVARLGLGIEGVLDASLPSALLLMVYACLGDIPAAIIVAAALLFVIPPPGREARCLGDEDNRDQVVTGFMKNAVSASHQLKNSLRFALSVKPKTTTSHFRCSDRPQFYPILRAGYDCYGAHEACPSYCLIPGARSQERC